MTRKLSTWFPSIALVAVLLASPRASAQLTDSLVAVSGEELPWSKDRDDPARQFRLRIVRVGVGMPLPLARRTYLLPGVAFEQISVGARGDVAGAPAPTLRSVMASLGIAQGIGEHWTVIAIGGLGLASDFAEPVSTRDLVVTATGLVTYKINDALSVGGGIVYDQRSGTPLPLPAALINWKPLPNLRVRGFVPARVDAEYRFAPWISAGIRATFNGGRYALSEHLYGQQDLQVAYSTAAVGPDVTLSLTDWLHFDVYAAAAVYRRYDVYRAGNDDGAVSLNPTVAYGFRFWIGPSTWDAPRAP